MTTNRMQCRVAGMACTGCAASIERGIAKLDGVESIKADFDAGRAVITFDPNRIGTDALMNAIRDLGYEVSEMSTE